MSVFGLPLDPSAFQARVLLWPLLFGLGAYLLLTAQPLGRPKPDLAERLRRLDVDERIKLELGRRAARPLFASRLLEVMLRPVLDDLGRLVRAALARVGLAAGRELERRLRVARPGVEPAQFFGEKVVSGLIGLALFPLMNWLGIHPFGPWAVWTWAAGFLVGFLAPDWQLEQTLAVRRTRCLMELPTMLDMLTIATSAGLALEQALVQVARQSAGTVAQELRHVSREMALGQRSLVEALEAMAERNAVPELTSFASQVRAAHEQGIPLVQTLSVQAEALREQKRLRIVEEGGKATVRMILPVALFILPVLFVVLLAPAAIELMRLGG
jgi:tight adherence protein C